MHMKIKLIFAFAALALLSGCADNQTVTSSAVVISAPAAASTAQTWGNITGETITIWGDGGNLNRPYFKKFFDSYEEQTGNIINIVELTKEEQDEKIFYAFNTEGAERPDILHTFGGAHFNNLKPEENFYDFTHAAWVDDLMDISINQTIYNGKVMGFPVGEASVSGTLYNKGVFERCGLEVPTTQEEFFAVCEALLKQGVTPMYLPYADITMLLYQFPMDSIVSDTDTLNALNSGELSYAQMPEMHKIVEWYKTMADKGYFGEDYEENNWDGMDGAMSSGQYGMMLCWDTWLYTNFTGNPAGFGLMPAFIGVPETGSFEGPNITLFAANKNSPQLDASLDLINFISDPVNYNMAMEGIYTAPVFKRQTGSMTTPQYVESERLIEKYFYDSIAWLRIEGFSQIDAKFIQDYMQGDCTLLECLNAMDQARIKRAGK